VASTTKSTVTNQVPVLYSTRLLAQAQNKTFWKRFEGPEGSSMPIIRKDDLTKSAGDTIKIDMVLALTGAGVTGDTNALAGNEEALKFRQLSVGVSDLSHAVRWTELVEQEINHDMRTTALNQLQKWLAEKLDASLFTELTGGGTTLPTPNQWFAGSATSINTLADGAGTGRLQLSDISDAKAYAQATLKIEPIQTADGNEYFGLVLDPFAALWLKKDTNYQQAFRDAQVRGDNNPLFTGAIGVWDGVILYSNNNVPTGTNTNTPAIRYASNVFFGAQAAARAYAQYPDWREEFFDYGRSAGIATVHIKGDKLSVFDLSSAGDGSGNQAIGSMVLYTAAVAPTA
jgi:N4-gp56 family major capsid protein